MPTVSCSVVVQPLARGDLWFGGTAILEGEKQFRTLLESSLVISSTDFVAGIALLLQIGVQSCFASTGHPIIEVSEHYCLVMIKCL